jgi:hypothetical protein
MAEGQLTARIVLKEPTPPRRKQVAELVTTVVSPEVRESRAENTAEKPLAHRVVGGTSFLRRW